MLGGHVALHRLTRPDIVVIDHVCLSLRRMVQPEVWMESLRGESAQERIRRATAQAVYGFHMVGIIVSKGSVTNGLRVAHDA